MNWHEVFIYKDGNLYWKSKRGPIKEGQLAGGKHDTGYLTVGYKGRYYLVHRIIWEMHNGPIPEGMQVDHIWHDRGDNRIEKLRLVTHKCNGVNQSKCKRNSSGVTGVTLDKQTGKWRCYIHVNSKQINLGTFSDIKDAVNARLSAEHKYGFHVNHGT